MRSAIKTESVRPYLNLPLHVSLLILLADSLVLTFISILITAQKTNFSVKDFFSKYDQIHRNVRVTFTKEIYNEKLYAFCSGNHWFQHK